MVVPARAQAPTLTTPGAPAVGGAEPADKVVLKVGDQQFTKADLDFLVANVAPQAQRAMAMQGKKALGDQFATIVMLAEQARQLHLDQNPDFVRRLALQKQQMEAQAAYAEINLQSNVTPEELNKYYTDHAADYDEITVRQIVVRKKNVPQNSDLAHPMSMSGSGLSPEEAKTRIEAIRKELVAGTDIKKVMDDFKDPGNVVIEAEPRKVRRGGMRAEFENAAFALKDGEISQPVDATQAYVMFQVTGHSHLDLKDATPEIERALKQQKVNAAIAEVKKKNVVWMDDQYFAAPARPGAPTLGPAPSPATPPAARAPKP